MNLQIMVRLDLELISQINSTHPTVWRHNVVCRDVNSGLKIHKINK